MRIRFFGNEGWIVGGRNGHGLLFKTHNAGRTWQSQSLKSPTALLFDVHFTGAKGWIVGENGTILSSDDYGLTWVPQASPTSETLTSLFFLTKDLGWAGGDKQTLLRLNK